MTARWTVVVDGDHTVVVEAIGDSRIVVELVQRRRGRLLRFGRRMTLTAEPKVFEDFRQKLGAAIGVARWERCEPAGRAR